MADRFRSAGFDEVILRQDVGNLDFKRALRRFEDAASGAEIAVIYFAGHGIEINGMNFMIPVDARLASDRDASDESISLDRLIRSAEPAGRLRLIILDACRDNPFVRKMKRRTAFRSLSSGLGGVEPARTATLVAYASKGGSTADDGDGAHSPFTQALLNHLFVPGLDLRLAFGRVRDEVLKLTNRRQEPYVYGSLGGANVALLPRAATPPASGTSLADMKSDYELVARIGSRRAWEVFLSNHTHGQYADMARAQIAKLDGVPAAAKDGAKFAALAPSAGASVDAELQDADGKRGEVAVPDPAGCRHEQELIARLKQLGSPARQELAGLRRSLSCERLRPALLAALGEPTAAGRPDMEQAATEPDEPDPDSRQLVTKVQMQLARVGCLDGTADGVLGPVTESAIRRYLSLRRTAAVQSDAITPDLLDQISQEKRRVCLSACKSTKPSGCGAVAHRARAAKRDGAQKARHHARRERPPVVLPAGKPWRPSVRASAMIGVGF
jgi:hypothetical protein